MARDVNFEIGAHVLQHGDTLKDDVVTGRLYGRTGAPLIVIPGGISASRFVADGTGIGAGWWADIVSYGGAIDLNQYQVLGIDLAPCSKNTKTRVTITTNDQAKRIAALLDHMGVARAVAIIGMSYGGMVAQAFAQNYPDRLGQLCLLGAAHKPFAMGVAIRGIQRRIIDFAIKAGRADEGLKLARELAMTTYRSPEEFTKRFDVEPIKASPVRFDAGEYLENCGRKYPGVMPIYRFLALSESIDLHRIDPAKITAPTLLIATRSDQLAPPAEIESFKNLLGGPSEMVVLDSVYGHDSFLKDTGLIAPILSNFIGENCLAA